MSIAPSWMGQHSVEVPVSFAWAYMTDISNWNDPPAVLALGGPFSEGTRGSTEMPGRRVAACTIRDVDPGRSYTIESDGFLERAVLLAHWRFDALSERTARLTQRLELLGENAAAYIDEMRSLFEPNMESGLRRIARRMEGSREPRTAQP